MWSEYQQGFDHFRNVSIYVMKLRKVEVTGERKNSLHIFVLVYMYCFFVLFLSDLDFISWIPVYQTSQNIQQSEIALLLQPPAKLSLCWKRRKTRWSLRAKTRQVRQV